MISIKLRLDPWVYKGKTIFFVESNRRKTNCVYFLKYKHKIFYPIYFKAKVKIGGNDFNLQLISIYIERIEYCKSIIKNLTDIKDELCTL